jgi:peptidylprolyl isomerase
VRRAIATLIVPVCLVTAACGSSASTTKKLHTISDITVTGGFTHAPKVEFPKPFSVKKTQTKVVHRGSSKGPRVRADSVVTVKFLEYVGRDGVSVGADPSTAIRPWTASSQPYRFALNGNLIRGVRQGLLGTRAGDAVLMAIAPKDAYDPTGDGKTVVPGDSIVALVDVLAVTNPLTKATGRKVPTPASVPVLKTNSKGIPTGFRAGKQVPASVSKLGVYPVIEGTGPKVTTGQTLSVQYLGQLYPAKAIFDQSWSRGQPFSFQLGQGVIQGWSQGLLGQRVGSRVILVIPPALGYGKAGSPPKIPKNAPLIFSVDILSAY